MEYFRTILSLTVTLTKRYMRDRVALFFTFIFPIIFLFVFGGLFRNANPQFDIAVINNANTPYSNEVVNIINSQKAIFKVKTVKSFDDAKKRMGRGELDSIVELPAFFGETGQGDKPSGKLVVYFKESDAQSGQTFATVMETIVAELNKPYLSEQPPLGLEQRPLKTANLTQFDYTFSGLLGFSLLSLGIFSMANGFTSDKKEGILRRMRTTPLKSSQLIIATGLNRLVVGLVVVTVMFLVAILVLDYNLRANIISLVLYLIISIVMMFGFGMAVSGWAKNENQAAPLSNIVAFPMMFLSGSFFPRFLMPQWLQNISNYLPLTPVIDGLRFVLTEGKTIFDLGPQLTIIAVWTVIIYLIAFRAFRWE